MKLENSHAQRTAWKLEVYVEAGGGALHDIGHRNRLCVPLLIAVLVAKYLAETASEKRGLFLADGYGMDNTMEGKAGQLECLASGCFQQDATAQEAESSGCMRSLVITLKSLAPIDSLMPAKSMSKRFYSPKNSAPC